jgi:hypothetical protein
MKRFWAQVLCFVLAVGVLVVTTPCDCKAASEAFQKISPAQNETCPLCAKRNAPTVRPVLDQRAVATDQSSLNVQPALVLPSLMASYFEVVRDFVSSPIYVQFSPPSSSRQILRI